MASMVDEVGGIEGRRIVVTRHGDQAAATCARLARAGAEPIPMPMIAVEVTRDIGSLERALARGPRYVLVTSANAVSSLARAWPCAMGDMEVCSVGPATTKRLEEAGIAVDIEAEDHRAEGLLARLAPLVGPSVGLVWPCASVVRPVLADGLRLHGAEVEVVPVYSTVVPAEDEYAHGMAELRGRRVDAILFSSPSTVSHFAEIAGDALQNLLAKVTVAAIGPVTAAACAEFGVDVAVIPQKYTFAALISALGAYWAEG